MRTRHLHWRAGWVFSVLLAGMLGAQQPGGDAAAAPRQVRGHRLLEDGRLVVADELKVTLTEKAARRLSRDPAGKAVRVDRVPLKALSPEIDAIVARHASSRCWLDGEALPPAVRGTGGSVPRIARNFSVRLKPGADLIGVREVLRRHPSVERVDLKVLNRTEAVPNDPGYSSQWAPAVIGLDQAWEVVPRGRVRVAVVDNGVRLSHPEFAGRVVFQRGYGDFDGGDAPQTGSGSDHGTHVAGIIAAERDNNLGVAGYSNAIDLMVMNCATWDEAEGEWRIVNADDAIDDAVANGAAVINCSFSFDEDLEDEVEGAYDAGVLVVHAAGNAAASIAGHWESGSIALLTVTATMPTTNRPPADVFDASYSNFGPGVDLAAPGTRIFSVIEGGFGNKQGTSMAAPQVSGAAALVMSLNPTRIGDESSRHLLIRMAQDKGPPGVDEQYGFGVLRLRRPVLDALRFADGFLSRESVFPDETGNYDRPWRTLSAAFANVPDGAVLVLNGGTTDVSVHTYPAQTITKPCILTVIPDRPALLGRP